MLHNRIDANTNDLINQPLQVFIQRRNIIVSRTLFIPLHKLKMYLLHSTLCHIISYVLTTQESHSFFTTKTVSKLCHPFCRLFCILNAFVP